MEVLGVCISIAHKCQLFIQEEKLSFHLMGKTRKDINCIIFCCAAGDFFLISLHFVYKYF